MPLSTLRALMFLPSRNILHALHNMDASHRLLARSRALRGRSKEGLGLSEEEVFGRDGLEPFEMRLIECKASAAGAAGACRGPETETRREAKDGRCLLLERDCVCYIDRYAAQARRRRPPIASPVPGHQLSRHILCRDTCANIGVSRRFPTTYFHFHWQMKRMSSVEKDMRRQSAHIESAVGSTELALAHASLQAKHNDTLLTLARLQNSKASITFQIDHLKDRYENWDVTCHQRTFRARGGVGEYLACPH
jgi:hypothetical protein